MDTRAVSVAGSGVLPFLGLLIPVAPVAIGLLATLLVRIPLMKIGPRFVKELTITLLAMLGCFVTIVDRQLGAGLAFWTGLGFGAIGSGMIELAKSAIMIALAERLRLAGRVMFGLNRETDDERQGPI